MFNGGDRASPGTGPSLRMVSLFQPHKAVAPPLSTKRRPKKHSSSSKHTSCWVPQVALTAGQEAFQSWLSQPARNERQSPRASLHSPALASTEDPRPGKVPVSLHFWIPALRGFGPKPFPNVRCKSKLAFIGSSRRPWHVTQKLHLQMGFKAREGTLVDGQLGS